MAYSDWGAWDRSSLNWRNWGGTRRTTCRQQCWFSCGSSLGYTACSGFTKCHWCCRCHWNYPCSWRGGCASAFCGWRSTPSAHRGRSPWLQQCRLWGMTTPFLRLLSVSPCDIEWISMFYKYVHTFYIFYTLINIYSHYFLFKSHIFSQYHCFHSLASPIHFTHAGFSSTFLYFFSKNSVWW